MVKFKKYFPLVLVIIFTLFIWINSLLTGNISSNQSGLIVKFIYPLFKNIFSIETTSLLVRKLAHFTEYFILGLILYYFYSKLVTENKRLLILTILVQGLITAAIDETIQLFIPGRAGMITDVLIDFTGIIFSVLIIWLYKLLNIKLKRSSNS